MHDVNSSPYSHHSRIPEVTVSEWITLQTLHCRFRPGTLRVGLILKTCFSSLRRNIHVCAAYNATLHRKHTDLFNSFFEDKANVISNIERGLQQKDVGRQHSLSKSTVIDYLSDYDKRFQGTLRGSPVRVYREDGLRHDQRYCTDVKDRGALAYRVWMSYDGPGVIERIDGRFNAETYEHILENIFLMRTFSRRNIAVPAG
ncbi:hypothetical protein ANN_04163 [Periplaneta americana]|uniref:Uncharacterized protein n=1 Tax=Periplaneta americana TaxID=6978 RepID=A0ABQ8T9C6_PERAM|nr:hypothetical protein ANN_04163 [Periplaneta americana]